MKEEMFEKFAGAKMFSSPEKITKEFYNKYCHPQIDEDGEFRVNIHGGIESYDFIEGTLCLIDTFSEYSRGSKNTRGMFTCGKPEPLQDINEFCLDCLNDRMDRFAPSMVFQNNRIRMIDWSPKNQRFRSLVKAALQLE